MTLTGAQRIIELENEIAELRRQLATHTGPPARIRSPDGDTHLADEPRHDTSLIREGSIAN
jgi:hypothetical protein